MRALAPKPTQRVSSLNCLVNEKTRLRRNQHRHKGQVTEGVSQTRRRSIDPESVNRSGSSPSKNGATKES